VEDFADGLGCNVTITSEDDRTFMFFGHGEKVATWICGDKDDDLPFYGITRETHPTSGYLRRATRQHWEEKIRLQTPIVSREKYQGNGAPRHSATLDSETRK